MLILTRKVGESIVLGDAVKVKVVAIEGNQIKLGFEAQSEIAIFREEVIDKIKNITVEEESKI